MTPCAPADFSALGALTMNTPITSFLAQLQSRQRHDLASVEDIVADRFNEFCTAATCVAVRARPSCCPLIPAALMPAALACKHPAQGMQHAAPQLHTWGGVEQGPTVQESEVTVSTDVSKDISLNKTAVALLTKSSRCIGKTATLALEPWSCTFDLDTKPKEVTCTPAVLVLQKTPGTLLQQACAVLALQACPVPCMARAAPCHAHGCIVVPCTIAQCCCTCAMSCMRLSATPDACMLLQPSATSR